MAGKVTVAPPRRVEAELLLRSMKAGRNGALLVQARTAEDAPVECVVKLKAAMAADHGVLVPFPYLCEWFAAAMARVLGIHVPEPFELVVTKAFADALLDDKERTIARASIGSAFASGYVSKGLTQHTKELPDPGLREPAAELAAFDMLIHNPDRRRSNPNLLVSRAELVAIDHGDAFSFVFPIFGAPDPAIDPLLTVVEEHAVRDWLRGTEFSLERFRDALTRLTDEVLAEIATGTPSAWQTGFAVGKSKEIVDVMKRRRDAAEKWLPQVEACLAR